MRKIILVVLTLTIMVLANCCGHKPKVEVLEGNPQLSTFTQLDKDGKTVLTGVANPQSGHVVVEPAEYTKITADENVITCVRADGKIDVFTEIGHPIGTFEMFTPWKYNGTYYLGVKYLDKTYYFPQKHFIVSSRNVITEQDVLFCESQNGWEVLTYNGEQLWKISSDFLIIRNAANPSQIFIAIETEEAKPSCTLFTVNGGQHKKLTPKQWKKLKQATTATDNEYVVTIKNFNDL